jgi:hypothetical protein
MLGTCDDLARNETFGVAGRTKTMPAVRLAHGTAFGTGRTPPRRTLQTGREQGRREIRTVVLAIRVSGICVGIRLSGGFACQHL